MVKTKQALCQPLSEGETPYFRVGNNLIFFPELTVALPGASEVQT